MNRRLASLISILSFLALGVSLGSRVVAQEIQWARNPANNHWYGIPYDPTTWTAGETLGVQLGGHLATVRNLSENTWISQNFAGFNSTAYWIGFNDVTLEGAFVWTSAETPGYTNWIPGQPDNAGGNEDGVEMDPGSSWRWNDKITSNPAFTPIVELGQVPQIGWTLPTSYPTQTAPQALAIADLDGDGRLDIVVSNRTSNTLSVFLGQSGGTFAAGPIIATSQSPQAVEIADFDGDTRLDVAVTCFDASLVRVHFGDGSGGFNAGVQIALPGKASGLAVADLDGDGRPDMAVTTVQTLDRLLVIRNAGGGLFDTPAIYPTGSRPNYVSAGDLDGDGIIDLVVSNFDSNDLGFYHNLGNGVFTTSALFARGHGPCRVAIGDLDGDGLNDLVVPQRLDSVAQLVFNGGNGTFFFGQTLTTGSDPVWASTADLDGDGRIDFVVASSVGSSLSVCHALGLGQFAQPHTLFAAGGAACVRSADVDGDGRPDLIVACTSTNKVLVIDKISRDCNGNGVDDPNDIALGTSVDCNANGVPDECDLAQGPVFDCDGNGSIDSCEIVANGSLDLNHNGILDQCETAGSPYCFGDGSHAACPCDPGQAGPAGHGCLNSHGVGGRLEAVGNPAVSADSVSLRGTDLLPGASALFFQGQIQQNGGNGTGFGDGLLCVNQAVIRLAIRVATPASTVVFGRDNSADPDVSMVGQIPAAGGTRFYQVWYRDPLPFCTPATYNLTNGVRIVWLP